MRDGGNAVAIAVQMLARHDANTADVDQNGDLKDMAIAERADGAVGKAKEAHSLDVIEIAGHSARDQADRAELRVGSTHHFAEDRGHHRPVEILKDNDRRTGHPSVHGTC